jgi:hypothetical protein
MHRIFVAAFCGLFVAPTWILAPSHMATAEFRRVPVALVHAQWVQDIAAQRGVIDAEIVDLRDFPMPFFDEVAFWSVTGLTLIFDFGHCAGGEIT